MTIDSLKNIGWFLVLVLLQAMVMNHICILGYAKPLIYVYLILVISSTTSRLALLLWGFCLGLAVDIFSNTLGLNTAATTFLAFVRPGLLNLFITHESPENAVCPGFHSFGVAKFFRYVLIAVLIHHLLVFTLESFSFFDWFYLLVATVSSALLTTLCVGAIDCIGKK